MHQQKPSVAVEALAEELRDMWETRIVLAPGGRVSNEPPPDAKLMPRPDFERAAGARCGLELLPSLLYARERYGALPEVQRAVCDYLRP